jgi:hypothetical protein
LFAVSILLTAVFYKFSNTTQELDDLFSHIDRAIAVLQVMDECVVTRNAICIIKRALSRAKQAAHPEFDTARDSSDAARPQADVGMAVWDTTDMGQSDEATMVPSFVANEGTAVNSTVDGDLSWLNSFQFDDGHQALFWTEWARELDVLGT